MSGELKIGGLTLHCSGGLVQNINRRGPKKAHKSGRKSRKSSQESQDEAWEEYVQNLAEQAGGSDSDDVGRSAGKTAPTFGRGSHGTGYLQGPFVEDMTPEGERLTSSYESSLADSEDNTESSSGPSVSDVAEDLGDRLVLQDGRPGLPEGLDPPQRSPGSGRKRRSREFSREGTPGQKTGQPHAVTGKRLKKRQKTPAKKGSGVDLTAVNRTLHELVLNDGDIEAFPPMRKEGRDRVRQLAALYGMKSSEQCGRGEKRFVMVRVTKRSRLPGGRQAEELATLLSLAAAADESSPPAGKGVSSRSRKRKPKPRKGRTPSKEEGYQAEPEPRVPISFVSHGMLEDAETAHVVVHPHGRRESGGNAMATPSVETSLRSEGSGECEAAVESAQGRDIELEEEIGPSCMGLGSPPTAEASEHSMLRSEGDGKDGGQYLEVFEDRQLGSLTEVAKTPIHAKGLSQEDYFERLEEESQPSVLRTRAQCKQARKKLEKEQRRAARRDAGELPRLPDQIGPLMAQGGTYGQFEQHTRGIGSKLLAQMGFAGKGTGLGRDSQGMAEPLRAVARPKQLGLGA